MLHRFRFIFFLAITLHLTWAVLLLSDASPAGTTPISQTATIFGRYWTAAVFAVVGLAALYALWRDNANPFWLIPQTAILGAATAGGLAAVASGQYADGTARPWQFILADQLPTILLALFHLIAVILVVDEADADDVLE